MGPTDRYLEWCDRWLPFYSRPEPTEGTAPCERCGEPIDVDRTACPSCGNSPYTSAKWSGVAIMLLALPLMYFPVLGLLVFLVGLSVRISARTLSPTDHDFGAMDDPDRNGA